ncbi:MAG: MFS transporter [Pseudomonadota bacterium]
MTPDATLPSSPLAIRDFRRVLLARFATNFATIGMVVILGYQAYDVARAHYGYTIREGAFLLGMIGFAQFVPLFILTPFAGWTADRFERTLVARLATGIDLCIALTLAVTTHLGLLSLPLIFALAALHGTARVFIGPAMSAVTPNVVPAPLLPKAIAMGSAGWQAAAMTGPAVAGVLYAIDPAASYWVASVLIAIGLVAISTIRKIVPPPLSRDTTPIRQMVDGLTYIRGHRFLLGAITLDLFAVLLGGATALLPIYARDILHAGSAGLGALRAAVAVGATLVAIWFSFRPLQNEVGVKMLAAVAGFGLFTAAFGLSGDIPRTEFSIPLGFATFDVTTQLVFALLMLALLGGCDMLSVYVRSSLIQLHTPDTMRGRVSAASSLAVSASNELGEARAGLFAAALGPVGAVVIGGVGAVAIALGWAYLFPELRRARTFDPPPVILDEAELQERPA